MVKIVPCLLLSVVLFFGCQPTTPGASLLHEGKYPEAVTLLSEQVAAKPNDWQLHEMLGYAKLKADDSSGAIASLVRAIELAPQKASKSRLYLGLAHLQREDFGAALDVWRRFDDPTMPLVKAEIGRLSTLVDVELSKKLAREALAGETSLSVAAVKPNSYAIFDFVVQGEDATLPALQKALTAMTITDLSKVEDISIIERTRLQALIDEIKLGQSGAVEQSFAPKAGRLLGAEKLVVGKMNTGSGVISVASSTASTAKGAVVGAFSLSEVKDKFFVLQKSVVANILTVNNITVDRQKKELLLGGYHTRSYQAVVYYGQGLEAMDHGDWQTSKDYFDLAVKEDPGFLMARIARDRAPFGIFLHSGQKLYTEVCKVLETAIALQTQATGVTTTNAMPQLPSSSVPRPRGHSTCS